MKLISYKSYFKNTESPASLQQAVAQRVNLALKSQDFIETFCSHDLANSDYVAIQIEPMRFNSTEEWVAQMDIDTVLKSITYVIWTDRIVDGYFTSKTNDGFLYMVIQRLENLLHLQPEIVAEK